MISWEPASRGRKNPRLKREGNSQRVGPSMHEISIESFLSRFSPCFLLLLQKNMLGDSLENLGWPYCRHVWRMMSNNYILLYSFGEGSQRYTIHYSSITIYDMVLEEDTC